MNPFKKTGFVKITIGDPWSPDSGNWIHVTAVQHARHAGRNPNAYTEVVHRFKVDDYGKILPRLLELAASFNEAGRSISAE